MNQQKIGTFLKELRNEKNITQEQLAEKLGVSRRTVSRWETGSNMPDLDLLIVMADHYEVDLRELLDGERNSEKMNKELEETVLKGHCLSGHRAAAFCRPDRFGERVGAPIFRCTVRHSGEYALLCGEPGILQSRLSLQCR